MRLAYAPAPSDCSAAGRYTPTLTPGEEFSVCVTVTVRIPLLPDFVDSNTATGQFVVERDRYVERLRLTPRGAASPDGPRGGRSRILPGAFGPGWFLLSAA